LSKKTAILESEPVFDTSAHRRALRRNRYEAAIWGIFGLVFYLLTFSFDHPLPNYKLGAAFWPQVVLIGVMLFAGILFASTFLGRPAHEHQRQEHSISEALHDERIALSPKLVAFFIVPLIWVFAMRWIGFPLTAPVFLAVFLWLVGIRRLWVILLYTVLFDAILMLLFYKLIFTPMPQGAGWFYTLNGYIIGFMQ
jgi:hypothetical protein